MLFGCVHIPNFSCQAAVRADPILGDKAVAVIDGSPPLVRVIAINATARKLGLEIGMTKTEAESCPGLLIRERSLALEASAHAALVDCVARFSPRCEDVSVDTIVIDLSGLEKLMGTPLKIAQSIREQANALSLYVNVGVASNIDSAMHAARVAKGIRVLPAGKEGEELQDVFTTVLDPSPEVLGVFERWGIRTLGQLTALPEIALTERLGQEGLRLQRLANGKSMRMLSPTEPPLEFRESMELDCPVADIESLSFIFARLLDHPYPHERSCEGERRCHRRLRFGVGCCHRSANAARYSLQSSHVSQCSGVPLQIGEANPSQLDQPGDHGLSIPDGLSLRLSSQQNHLAFIQSHSPLIRPGSSMPT